jgi:hypothetical protein
MDPLAFPVFLEYDQRWDEKDIELRVTNDEGRSMMRSLRQRPSCRIRSTRGWRNGSASDQSVTTARAH